jgi:hypothetical protein
MQPEEIESSRSIIEKPKLAAAWLALVTLAYLGTILAERGERIMKTLNSFWK